MKLTKDQRDLIIHALEREIDLERMGEEEIIEFAKEHNGVDTDYIIRLQEIIDLLTKQQAYYEWLSNCPVDINLINLQEIVDLFQKEKEKSNAND